MPLTAILALIGLVPQVIGLVETIVTDVENGTLPTVSAADLALLKKFIADLKAL